MNALCFFSLRPYVIFRQDSTISYMTSLHCGPVAPRLWAKRREGAPLDSKCTWTPPVITAQYFYPPSLHSRWQQLMQVEITHTLFYIVKTWQVGSLELCFNIKSPITIHLYILFTLQSSLYTQSLAIMQAHIGSTTARFWNVCIVDRIQTLSRQRG